MKRLMLLKSVIFLACCAQVFGQVPSAGDQAASSRRWQLGLNQKKLDISLTLDRDVYFPGEDAQVTIRIQNPTSQALEIPEPFNTLTGCVGIKRPRPGSNQSEWVYAWSNCGGGSVGIGDLPVPPTVWISPNQPIQRTFWLSDLGCVKPGTSFVGACHLNEAEGAYRVVYDYDIRAFAVYRIVWPDFEIAARVKLEKPGQMQDVANANQRAKTLTFLRYSRLAAVGSQGTHYIIASRHDGIGAPPEVDRSGKFTDLMSRGFSPYRRIGASSARIVSLAAVADSAENLTVTYADQSGRGGKLKLNSKRDLSQ